MPFRIKVSLAIIALLVAGVVFVPLLVPITPPADTAPLTEAIAATHRADGELLNVGGTEVYAITAGYDGPDDAPVTFVLLHGYASNAFSFDPAVPLLAEHGDVIAFDRPGFGLAARPDARSLPAEANPYSQAAQVRQAVELIEGLNARQVVLVGVDSGGILALEVALARPSLVAGLVLVAPPVYQVGKGRSAPRWLLRTPQLRRIGPVLLRQMAGQPGQQLYEGTWFDPSRITPEQRAARQVSTSVDGWDVALWQVTLAGGMPKLDGSLGNVTVPTLVVAGSARGSLPLTDAERLANDVRAGTLVQLDSCGDLPQEECPVEFVAAIADWLGRSASLAR